MRLTQIRDFLAVVEAGSINSAARKLGVSQPGLTKSLGSLEAELGASLLKRTPTGVTLTRLGQAFHVHARAGYAELAKAEAVTHAPKLQVTLGFGPFFAAQIVPQAVMSFREKFPQVELRLKEGFGYATRASTWPWRHVCRSLATIRPFASSPSRISTRSWSHAGVTRG